MSILFILRNLLSLYNNNADLISIGAYKHGTNPALDEAIRKIDRINEFLMQRVEESYTLEETVQLLIAARKIHCSLVPLHFWVPPATSEYFAQSAS